MNIYAAQLGSVTGFSRHPNLPYIKPPKHINASTIMEDYVASLVGRSCSGGTLTRTIYFPLCVAELVWDYADTIIDLSANLRIKEVINVSRSVKTLRAKYREKPSGMLEIDLDEELRKDIGYDFEESVKPILDRYCDNVEFDLRASVPDMNPEWIYFFKSVHSCLLLHRALMSFSGSKAMEINQATNYRLKHTFTPAFEVLSDIVRIFIGDVALSKSFRKTEKTYIDMLIRKMEQFPLTKLRHVLADLSAALECKYKDR